MLDKYEEELNEMLCEDIREANPGIKTDDELIFEDDVQERVRDIKHND